MMRQAIEVQAADAIVSGDSHLLELAEYQKIPIRSPAQFMADIPKLNPPAE